jgi:hypothetical protein
MRLVSLLSAAAVTLVLAGPAQAQAWAEFIDRQEYFTINLPGDPQVQSITYKTEKGTTLPAKFYVARDARGEYRVTVVNYATAPAETATAVAEAAKAMRLKGEVKYDNQENTDRIRDHRITVILPNGRQLLSLMMAHQNRLYITEADTAANVPPPAQFQASIQVLDDDGVRIRYNPDGVTRQR